MYPLVFSMLICVWYEGRILDPEESEREMKPDARNEIIRPSQRTRERVRQTQQLQATAHSAQASISSVNHRGLGGTFFDPFSAGTALLGRVRLLS